jgi:cytidine deaminase
MTLPRIGLKPAFFALVENGSKRSTIRAGAKSNVVGPATLVGGDFAVPVEITSVEIKRFADLTDVDAERDGFATLAELKEVLVTFYPSLGEDDPVSILHFSKAA